MSHTPTKTTHPPQEDATSPISSPLSPSRPSSLGGPRLNKARAEDMHRRHSSSISYRKSPPDEASRTYFHHARSSLASTWTQPKVAPNRHSLQLSPLHLYDHFHTVGSVVENSGQVPNGVPTPQSWAASEGIAIKTNRTPGSRTGSTSTSISNPSSSAPNRPLSLVEQHRDLLTFIAKKERRCLDLREELRKSEDELQKLKRKWEIVIGRSLASPTIAAGGSPPTVDTRRQSSILDSGLEKQPSLSPLSNSISDLKPEAARRQEASTNLHDTGHHSYQLPRETASTDSLRPDLISWDPFLQHIGPVSTVAKKWVGGIGKGFLDLLQETPDTPGPTPSPLRSRTARDGVVSANQYSLHHKPMLTSPTSPTMQTQLLLEQSIQTRDEAVSSALQREPSTVSSPSSPVIQLRMRTHAHSSSSTSNSVTDSFDADSSHRTSMSSIDPTSFSDADSATTTAVHYQTNTTNQTPIQSCSTGRSPCAEIAYEPCVIETESKLIALNDHDDRSPTAQFVSRGQSTPSGLNERQGNDPSITTGILAAEENLTNQPPDPFHSTKTIGFNHQSNQKHQSRRSTFDFLNSTTGQWTANLTKTLGDITNSETFQTSKRATLNFVDTVEKTFTEVITNDGSPRQEAGCSSRLDSTARASPSGENDKASDHVFEVPFY
ncbi:hypothetical protein DFH28DRAFT_949187 [Melampsora americana]|nr:hypothetical protein DFH28DRAFT_949187 [Melampsora americana]